MAFPLFYSILIASAIPLVFLFLIKWLNFFETHRARLIVIAVAWGAIAVEFSYLVDHPLVPILGRPFVGTHTAPVVEEIFKSLILVYLVRGADYTHFVDGAIYGFAAGIGFAVAENMLYLSRVDVNTGLIIAISRAFSSAMMHGSTTALVGITIGGFPLARAINPWLALIVGWVIAIACHMTYNHVAFTSSGPAGPFILFGAAFGALMLVAAAILWGLRRERRRLRKSLGMKAGVSKGEASLVQRIEDLDEFLAPVAKRFGEHKSEQVLNVLLLAAQLGFKQDLIRKTKDAELRVELAAQITEMKAQLKRQRRNVGLYVMSDVRSIVPRTTWSLWALLSQTLTKREAARTNLWTALDAALSPPVTQGDSMYARIQLELAARVRVGAATEHGNPLPASIQKFMQWVVD